MKRVAAGGVIPRITVRNLQRAVRVNVGALQASAEKALCLCLDIRQKRATPLTGLPEVSVLLISDRRMAALHRQFLKKSGPTDVMTFEHGEIFISAQTARHHACEFGNSLADELKLYVVHGLLHLHGYDDHRAPDARAMRARQRLILKGL
jgi:probable rRNA maturation factor